MLSCYSSLLLLANPASNSCQNEAEPGQDVTEHDQDAQARNEHDCLLTQKIEVSKFRKDKLEYPDFPRCENTDEAHQPAEEVVHRGRKAAVCGARQPIALIGE